MILKMELGKRKRAEERERYWSMGQREDKEQRGQSQVAVVVSGQQTKKPNKSESLWVLVKQEQRKSKEVYELPKSTGEKQTSRQGLGFARCGLAEKQGIKARLTDEKKDPGKYEVTERWGKREGPNSECGMNQSRWACKQIKGEFRQDCWWFVLFFFWRRRMQLAHCNTRR